MQRGRKPKPDKRPPAARPLAADDCPDYLDEAAREEWHRLCRSVPYLTVEHRAMVTVYCQAWSELKRLATEMADTKATVRAPSGLLRKHPLRDVYDVTAKRLMQTAAELGLSPCARSRVQSLPEAPDDETATFFADTRFEGN